MSSDSQTKMDLYTLLKRVLDVVFAVMTIILLAPIMGLIALAIRISSPGPILFVQPRLGMNGQPFGIFKFRTMIHNAPPVVNADGSTFTGDKDPRVTKIGRILRKTSLDELPQFFNVIQGTMSLVGPRPDLVSQLELYSEDEKEKLVVKPGITGLAQISGRNSISWADRKQKDIEYVRTRTLFMDASILIRTIPYVLLRKDVNT